MRNEIEVMRIENYCSKCGTKTRPQAKFCEGCGQKIQTSDEAKEQLIKEIEQEIKTKTRKEVLAEIQIEKAHQMQAEKERVSSQKKSSQEIITYKKGDWKYATAIIIFLVLFLFIIFVVL